MRNYRIAFFTVDWNYELVESTLHGLKQFADDHPNVRISVFDCFGKDQDSPKDRSEYMSYRLADLTQYDGALIQGNQIVLNRARQELTERIARAGIPAVSIDCPIEGCALIGIDNRKAQHDMTEHLIRHHGAKKLVYLTGLIENGCPEGMQRREGFLDACRENGISEDDIQIINCTWRTSDGIAVAEDWIRNAYALPDAFVCGNDEMAMGLTGALKEHGIRIPEDVLVTGFDDVSSAELSNPRLSTVHRDNMRLDYEALEFLISRIDRTDARDFVPYEHTLICSESCGCQKAVRTDYIRDRYYQQIRFLKGFYIQQDELAEELFEASDLQELMKIVGKRHQLFGCEHVYLCINGYYFDNYDKKHWTSSSDTFDREMVLYNAEESEQPEGKGPFVRFPAKDLLPEYLASKKRFLVFYPLHYNTYSIGYLAIDGISEAAKLNLHESIISFLEIAIENVRKKCLLREMNNALDDLYVHDALTGLYNRFGFRRDAPAIYKDFLARDGGAQILFIDMDDMKEINDVYGHETGDDAIRATSEVLRSACGGEVFLMRYGGDEFLVISSGKERELPDRILCAVREYNTSSELPVALSLSIGVVQSSASEPNSLEECIQRADAQMYDRKKRNKKNRVT